jgi:drug/metabolite transporter (DMT)-like permease
MQWFFVAAIAYFLIALQSVLDKFLLSSKRVAHPATYAFYSGLMSFLAFLLFPFGFHAVSLTVAALEILAGAVFIYGVLFLFFAIKDNEASQVIPVVGVVTVAVTYFFSFLILGERLSGGEIWGIIILIFGGLLISLDFSSDAARRIFRGFEFSLLAGVFMAMAYTMFKRFFMADGFVNVYIWTRFGLVFGAVSLLAYSGWRKAIFSSLFRFRKPAGNDASSGSIFVLNKVFGGIGSFLVNYAIKLGSVTIVNALVSLEYVFVFGLAFVFYKWAGKIFEEKRDFLALTQKFSAVIIIAIGMFFVSR